MTGSLGTTSGTRSGSQFRGHARHVSAKNLTTPYPRFLWQALKDKAHPDYETLAGILQRGTGRPDLP